MDIIVTDATVTVWETRLAEAEKALHELLIGKAAVSLNYDGEAVTFTRASKQQLEEYIQRMRVALGKKTRGSRPRARTVAFGGGFQ